MNEHPTDQPDQDRTDEPVREEFGHTGIEYVVLRRLPGADWDLHDGEVYSDLDAARDALSTARDYLSQAPAALWKELLNASDADFAPLAAEYERVKGAEASLFARAVSSFVRHD